MSEASASPPTIERVSLGRLASIALLVTLVVTTASYVAPAEYSAIAVAAGFLSAVWYLVLRHEGSVIRAYGLSLAGLLEPEPLEPRRLLREGLRGLLVAAFFLLLVAIPFFFGFKYWFHRGSFDVARMWPSYDSVLGQLLVIALPEEAFYRGYLQTQLDAHFPKEVRIFGLPISWSIVLTSAVFAVGHFLTIPVPARLAVFFPSLLFGAIRKREGGIGASLVFHALCNLLSGAVASGFAGPR